MNIDSVSELKFYHKSLSLNLIKILTLLIVISFSSGCIAQKGNRVCFKRHCFDVEVADDENERQRGMQLRSQLNKNEGMLFVFQYEGIHSFWMKDTIIPLDIIWLNASKEIVHIKENAIPCDRSYCENFSPSRNALYVFEVNSGVSQKVGWKVGDRLKFDLSLYMESMVE